ncbi:MAG: hypothetical protein EOO07_05030 [Chitinophagaceae bacterium]|nr:MAG: hypothetical protein EOO07_05030 [Chitinophagaceae bacterium]
MSSKLKLILKGSSFRVLQTVVSIVIGILMMPFLVSTLGKELYGLWIVIGSIVGTYYLLDLGFNQAVTRYVSKYIHQNNVEAANRTINTALVIYSLLGVVVLIASIIAAQFGAEKLMGSSSNLTLAQTILMITGLAFALEFPAKAFPGIISAYMRYDFIAMVRLSKSVVDALLIYYFISRGYGLVAMAVVTLVTGIISTFIYIRFTTSLFKELTFSKKAIDLSTLKDVFHFSKWVFVIDISTMLRDKMDIWFIAYYINNSALTVYYVAVRLVEYALQFLSQATGITGPIFTEYYAKGEVAKLTKSVVFFIKINITLGTLMFVGFYLLGGTFIEAWMKGSVSTQDAFFCLIILSMGRFAAYFSGPLSSLLMTINKHYIGAWVSIGETLVGFILCWLLIPKFGIAGAAGAIAIPYAIGRLIILPIISAKYVDLPFIAVLTRILMFHVATFVLVAGVLLVFPGIRHLSLLQLIAVAPLVAISQMMLSFVLWNREERVLIITTIHKKFQSLISKRIRHV